MPREFAEHPRVVDLEALYEEATGSSLRDVMAVVLALYAATINGTPRVVCDYLEPLGLTADAEAAVLRLLVADIDTLRNGVIEEVEKYGWNWSANTVSRHPVARLHNGEMLVLDASLLLGRAFGWLPLYDIQEGPSRVAGRRAEAALRHLAEAQAVNSVMRSVDGNRQSRVFAEEDLRQVPGRTGNKVCDAAVDYGDSWVLLEVTTSQLKRESVAALAGPYLDNDLNKLVPKAEQLHEAIVTLRAGQQHLTGTPGTPGTRYFPVLVLAEGFPVNPTTLTLLRERVHGAGFLTDPAVAPLELIDMEDLEVIEALQEQGGPCLRDLLKGKQEHNLRNVSMKDYVLLGLGMHPKRPSRLESGFSDAVDEVLKRMRAGAPNPEVGAA
jgi:hypothetical protein